MNSVKELFSKTEDCLNIVEEEVKNNIKDIKTIEEKRNENNYLISNLKYFPDIKTSLLQDTENLKKILNGSNLFVTFRLRRVITSPMLICKSR